MYCQPKNLISWSKKEIENFIWAKLKNTTQEVYLQKLWELLTLRSQGMVT